MLTQTFRGPGVPFGLPIRYRTSAEGGWRAGETVEINRSDLMFLCDAPLELHADVEVLLPSRVRLMGRESPQHLLCSGRVVRRLLNSLPDLRSAFVVEVSACRLATDEAYGEARAGLGADPQAIDYRARRPV